MSPTATVEDGTALAPIPAAPKYAGYIPSTEFVPRLDVATLAAGLGTREQIQAELDDMAECIRSFHLKQPDAVMLECSAYSARLTELAVLLHRVESLDRQYTRVRTQQVERWQSELDRQFKIASRLIEVQRQDIELARGA